MFLSHWAQFSLNPFQLMFLTASNIIVLVLVDVESSSKILQMAQKVFVRTKKVPYGTKSILENKKCFVYGTINVQATKRRSYRLK